MRLAPPLLYLLEAGNQAVATGDMQALPPLLEAALGFQQESASLFEATSMTLLMTDGGAERIQDVRDDFRRQREALDEIRAGSENENVHLLQKGLHQLEQCTLTLLEDLEQISQRERQRPLQSALPAIDQVIKIGINVADGHLPQDALRERMPLMVGTLQLLRGDVARFEALYEGPPEIGAAAREGIQTLETGIGALISALRSDNRVALMDGFRLLKSGSAGLLESLSRMDETARAQSHFSKLLALEETWRALQAFREGRVPVDTVRRAATILHSLGRLYAAQADQIGAYPLLFLVRGRYEQFRAAMETLQERAKPWFELLTSTPMMVASDEATAGRLRDAFENAADALTSLQAELERHAAALVGAPRLEGLLDALGRVASSTAPVEEGLRQVAEVRAAQDDVIAQIDEAGGGIATDEMRALLAEQQEAVDEMARYLQDGDEGHLRAGFEVLRETQPRLLRFQDQTRAVVEAQKAVRERTVVCLRCGSSNPWQNRYCQTCSAVLPVMSTQDETIYTDIVGAETPQALPGHLQRLQSLFDLAEGGGDLHAVQVELQQFYERFAQTAAEYDQGFGPHIESGQDERLTHFGRLFRANIAQMIEGIEVMLGGAQSAHVDRMARGLELTLAAGEEMRQAQQELHQLLGSSQG